ncbi:transcription antiterminator [Gemella sp. GH3]|uniref:BglG family transcription antiterminator n=1 Tax=unclassified Gemella TaxID=2624949 RepID=UPI0015D062F5|nr:MULTISPECIES: PRD domain-containing protein [unclassified Gemella]MBF0714015.1 transcription antiterminator [Gemella sp. GH3.1]NYS50967.1 transcription antiterminator [Gemella sp. GH3]
MSALSNREIQLLTILTEASDYLPVRAIAEKLNISKKTIYRDLEKIESKRSDIKFEKRQSRGIKINFSKISLETLQNKKVMRYSIEERRIKILLKLLKNSNKYTSIEALSEKYYVGKSSIVNDLKYIRNNLLGNILEIEQGRQGTKIIGSEKDIRLKIADLMSNYSLIVRNEYITDYYSERINSDTIIELSIRFGIDSIKKIEHIISNYEDSLPYTIGDLYYTNLVVHILIAIERIENGNYIVTNNKIGKDKSYYDVAINIAKDLEKEFFIEIPSSEIYYIYQYLVSTGVGELNEEYLINLDDNIEEISHKFLQKISLKNFILLNEDEHIYYVFKLHIRALVKRMKFNISIKNPLTEKIKKDYSTLFLSVKSISEEILHKEISDDEIAYLTVYIQAILENNPINKNVLLVCHSGFGTAQFLKKRLESTFSRLNIVDTISSRELRVYDLTKIDYIISTVKLPSKIKNVINVNVLLGEEDIKLINKEIFKE